MKTYLFLIAILISCYVQAQEKQIPDSLKVRSIEVVPAFPGGQQQFARFIEKSLIYPELASLTGKGGRVVVKFIVEKDGSIQEAEPLSCIGAGCEAEAVRIVKSSPKWSPGVQNGKAVRVTYSMPINFNIQKTYTPLKEFKRSAYGFVFLKDGKEYLVDELKKEIGANLQLSLIESLSPYPEPEKYSMPDKKEIYLIKLL